MDSVPPPSEQAERPLSFLAAAGWTLLAIILFTLIISFTETVHPGALFDLVSRTAGFALAYSVVFFAILRVHEPETSIRHVLALRAPSALATILAVIVGAALALPGAWLDALFSSRYPPSPDETQTLERLLSVATSGSRVKLIATVVVLGPIFDELFFRGALFTPLKRTRRVESVVIATAAYETLANFNVRELLSFFAATLAFSWIRGLTGSVIPGILARIAFYGVHFVPIALGRELPTPGRGILAASTGIAMAALVGVAALSRRDPRALDARLEDGE
jgi:CAAX protease family protein